MRKSKSNSSSSNVGVHPFDMQSFVACSRSQIPSAHPRPSHLGSRLTDCIEQKSNATRCAPRSQLVLEYLARVASVDVANKRRHNVVAKKVLHLRAQQGCDVSWHCKDVVLLRS